MPIRGTMWAAQAGPQRWLLCEDRRTKVENRALHASMVLYIVAKPVRVDLSRWAGLYPSKVGGKCKNNNAIDNLIDHLADVFLTSCWEYS